MHIRAASPGPLLSALLIAAGLALAGCSDEDARACALQGDCFVGEACVDGFCVQDPHPAGDTSSDGEGTSSKDTSSKDTSSTPGEDVDSTGGDFEDAENPADAESCLVDRFESSCEPDEYEPNESWGGVRALAPSDSWCEAGDALPVIRSFSARLCGQDTDIHTLTVLRATSNQCFGDQRLRIAVTVELEDIACDHELFKIFPFWNTGQDICESDTRVRCDWSEDGRSFEMIWAFDTTEYQTINFAVETREPEFKLDYDLKVKIDTW